MSEDIQISESNQINIVNPINYIIEKLSNIKGYNSQWITMVSSNPLLFEDVDYMRVLPYISNTVTKDELEAFNRGDLKHLYTSFEYLLMCNLKYYDRIITYCTMYFLNYYRIDDVVVDDNIPEHVIDMEITPTRIYCATMLNINSTQWEQKYAFGMNLKSDKFLVNYTILKKNKLYSLFISQRAFVNNTLGYRETMLSDKISDTRYYQICKKFTQQSNTVSRQQLNILNEYISMVDTRTLKLYKSLYDSMKQLYSINYKNIDNEQINKVSNEYESPYSIHVFFDEFFIHTTHFTMKVSKKFDKKANTITVSKDYLSNSYECFVAEPFFKNSVRQQIEWSKFQIGNKFLEIKNILKSILLNILNIDFKNVICVKYMCGVENIYKSENTIPDLSIIEFSGVFSNIYIKSTLKQNNKIVCKYNKCLNKENAAEYIINKGYYIFGYSDDVLKLLEKLKSNQYSLDEKLEFIKDHLSKYTTDIKQFLEPIIQVYKNKNNEIIDVYRNGMDELDSRISNDMIYLSDIKSQKYKDTKSIIKHINKSLKLKESNTHELKTYYQIVK